MIHIACIDISHLPNDAYAQLLSTASAERQAKARRYRRAEDSLRCVTADALLRYAVARAPGIPVPYTVEQGSNGKPYLTGAEQFHFNLSHSGNWVAIAYGGSPVGVDVEQIRRDTKKEAIARHHFTKTERDYVFSQGSGQAERFFQIWTGKESYLKYLGTGLTKALSSFCAIAPVVEDPPGTPLPDLYLHSFPLENACMSLCCREQAVELKELTFEDIRNI